MKEEKQQYMAPEIQEQDFSVFQADAATSEPQQGGGTPEIEE